MHITTFPITFSRGRGPAGEHRYARVLDGQTWKLVPSEFQRENTRLGARSLQMAVYNAARAAGKHAQARVVTDDDGRTWHVITRVVSADSPGARARSTPRPEFKRQFNRKFTAIEYDALIEIVAAIVEDGDADDSASVLTGVLLKLKAQCAHRFKDAASADE